VALRHKRSAEVTGDSSAKLVDHTQRVTPHNTYTASRLNQISTLSALHISVTQNTPPATCRNVQLNSETESIGVIDASPRRQVVNKTWLYTESSIYPVVNAAETSAKSRGMSRPMSSSRAWCHPPRPPHSDTACTCSRGCKEPQAGGRATPPEAEHQNRRKFQRPTTADFA